MPGGMASSLASFVRRASRGLVWAGYYVVAIAVGVELLVRLVMPQVLPVDAPEIYQTDDTIGWRHRPNVHANANTGDRDVEFCTDSRGDRVSCVTPAPADCSARILIVGDSFVEALAVPYEETAWALLQRETGACVAVAGVGAYEPAQYLQLVRERLADEGEPYDLVIASMFAGNDFVEQYAQLPSARSVWEQPVRLLPRGLDAASLVEWLYPVNQWLESRSHAYVAARFAIRNARDPGDVGIYGLPIAVVRERLTPAVVAATTGAFQAIAALTQARGTALLVTVVPVRSQVLDVSGERLRRTFPALAGQIDVDLVQAEFVPRLQAIEGVRTVDLVPAFRAESAPASLWGVRDQHLSPAGHAAWFRALKEPVRAALVASRASPKSLKDPV